MEKMITVFTPTYNRAHLLPSLYESLLRQTSKNFCWYIIDDGSVDNTKEVVNAMIAEKKIDIIYEYQENSGKHVAHNRAVERCDTELFMCIDSDDYLTDNAICEIENAWKKEEDKEKLSGVIGNCGDRDGNVIGTDFPQGIKKEGLMQLYDIGKKGDTTIAFNTQVIKKYPFPVFLGERFLREHIVYDEIDKDYKFIVINKVLCICEYLNDGLSINATKIEFKNPKGAALARLHDAKKTRGIKKMRKLSAYVLFSLIAKDFRGARREIGRIKAWMLLPLAAAGYLRYKIKRQIG